MDRRKFMKNAFIGGIIGTVCTKSEGEIIEIKERDKRGNLIYWEDKNGNKIRMEYGNNDNLIYMRINDKVEIPDNIVKEKYDDNGNYIYRKLSNGQEFWYTYDKRNRCISYITEDGYEAFLKYDENDMLVDFQNSYR